MQALLVELEKQNLNVMSIPHQLKSLHLQARPILLLHHRTRLSKMFLEYRLRYFRPTQIHCLRRRHFYYPHPPRHYIRHRNINRTHMTKAKQRVVRFATKKEMARVQETLTLQPMQQQEMQPMHALIGEPLRLVRSRISQGSSTVLVTAVAAVAAAHLAQFTLFLGKSIQEGNPFFLLYYTLPERIKRQIVRVDKDNIQLF